MAACYLITFLLQAIDGSTSINEENNLVVACPQPPALKVINLLRKLSLSTDTVTPAYSIIKHNDSDRRFP